MTDPTFEGSSAMATRGFVGRHRPARDERLPPGQYDVGDGWPVLTAEVVPRVDPQTWTMTVDGLVENAHTWSWKEMHELPQTEYAGDIHCVTTWSKFGTTFQGVSVDELLAVAGPKASATHVVATSTTGYTTNLPLEHVTGGKAWVVWSFDHQPLTPPHGGPVRLLVPHLYFWKSAKWVTQLTLLDHDEHGFWERNGYHDLGDPWLEQRYQGD
jgi:DMSO/TMAO reductase YedYZ molybdopterin-dependent catalytic subunit